MNAKPLITVLLMNCSLFLPGCIVQDIHDQIALSNQNLSGIQERLSSIDEKLGLIDGNLESMDGQIGVLEEDLSGVGEDLGAVSEHLASLRKTISNIDSTIPFLKLSDDEEDSIDGAGVEGESDAGDVDGTKIKADPAGGGE